ncbi:MAG: hypothetical protein EU551_03525, partial [Promethearchaeota archaeon]
MNGEIAQIVALTCHANAFLKGEKIDKFYPNNSTCKFCKKISFVEIIKNSQGKSEIGEILASTPDKWFSFLKSNKSKGVRINRIAQSEDDRLNIGFVGQGG